MIKEEENPQSLSEYSPISKPTVLRDRGGRIRWHLPGNTLEENERLGIRNVQALFLEKFPDFNLQFLRDQDGKVDGNRVEQAREFILSHVFKNRQFYMSFGVACDKRSCPYFEGSYLVVFKKSFAPWGIELPGNEIAKDTSPNGDKNRPIILKDAIGQVRWKFPDKTTEENEQIGIGNIQGLFLENFPEFNDLFPRDDDGQIKSNFQETAKEFIKEKIGNQIKFAQIIGGTPVQKGAVPYFQGSYITAIKKAFKPWGVQFNNSDFAHPRIWHTRDREEIFEAVREIFLQEFPDFIETFLDKDGTVITGRIEEAKQFVREKVRSKKNFSRMFGNPRREHPSFENLRLEILKSAFSPLGIEFSEEELKGGTEAPEGWITITELAKRLGKTRRPIERLIKQIGDQHPESAKNYVARNGFLRDHYSPEFVSFLTNELTKYDIVPEGWVPNARLAELVEKSPKFVERLAEKYKKEHLDWFKTFLSRTGHPNNYYSPEFVALIIEHVANFKNQPDGWITKEALAKEIKRSTLIVGNRADKFKENHPEWHQFYVDSNGRIREHYSPELKELIIKELTRYGRAPEGWMTRGGIMDHLRKKNSRVIDQIAKEFRKDHQEWFEIYLDQGGHPIEHYAPELIQLIVEIIEKQNNRDKAQPISPDEANEQLVKLLEA
ncbi:hypothetical protein HYU92_02795 [Candidatus Curtissbacteria bacterium]|nr:hypothetical protein [Candidatus Curtissbacteria bacterium]